MNIEVISASAGSGKTWTLAERMHRAIVDGSARPDALVAITYTRKAAAELTRRLRQRLLADGREADAARIRDGYVGTVHSVCQRLVADLAFAASKSPFPEPAPEGYAHQLFQETVGAVTQDALDELTPILEALALLSADGRAKGTWSPDSLGDVLLALVQASRENRLTPEALAESARQSIAGVVSLLDPPQGTEEERDQALWAGVRAVEAGAQARLDGGSRAAVDHRRLDWARGLVRTLDRGLVPSWTDLAGALGGDWSPASVAEVIDPLRRELARHLSHPRLHRELTQAIQAAFGLTAQVEQAFGSLKASERLLEFSDMLAGAAEALALPAAAELLEGRLDLLLVDEFQDTSPVQLQVILALADRATRTLWVGDRKQAIFGFQGSDPALMEAATDAVLAGRSPEVLDQSFRSRPPLVTLCSEIFARGLAPHGVPEEAVRLDPACPEPAALSGRPALHLWQTQKDPAQPKAPTHEGNGIARAIADILASGDLQVRGSIDDPRQEAPTRPARAKDFAVLARTNDQCRAIAASLAACGVPARVAQDGLNGTPEALLLRAGLALLADPGDALAAAEISWFTAQAPDPDTWLTERIAARAASGTAGATDLAFAHVPQVAAIRALEGQAAWLTPEEAVLAVFAALDAPTQLLSWPDPRQHLANLEVLRAVAVTYQDGCAARRSAATVAGLVAHLDALTGDTEQALPMAEDAVRVLTWHKAKGLEWPVVVCASLGTPRESSVFGTRVAAAPTFDPLAPLAGRTLRWWPSPYGRKYKGLAYMERGGESAEAEALEDWRRAESARLLYVGFTRARDHLVLSATGFGKAPTGWLDELCGLEGEPVLDLPWATPGPGEVALGERTWPVSVRHVSGADPAQGTAPAHQAAWFTRPGKATPRSAQPIRPSDQALPAERAASVRVAATVRLGERLQVADRHVRWDELGTTIHQFLADDPAGEDRVRLRRAAALLKRSGMQAALTPQALVDISTRFEAWLTTHAPGPRRPEWPVRWRRSDGRVLSGDIDLLVETGSGWLLLDHKSFPGDQAGLAERVPKWAGQLAAYGEAVMAASGRPVEEFWIHLPLRGEVVQLVW